MIVSSFLPAVTQMIYDMGLQDMLEGITFECPAQALNEKTPVVRCVLEGKNYTSKEIDTLFSNSKNKGESLYYVDQEKLEQILPDVIFTQDVCEVCQIDTECTAAAVSMLEKTPEIIAITPQSLDDVFDSVLTIAKVLGQEKIGRAHVDALMQRIDDVIDIQRKNRLQPKSVLLLEWIDPLFNCGHWIPHQIAYAGGIDMMSHPSGDSIVIPWDKIVKYNPEVLVIAPCGYTVARTLEDMKFLEEMPEWNSLRAVQNNQVYIADFDMFTQPSASTLVNGIESLAKMIHPDYYKTSPELNSKFYNYKDLLVSKL
ncbi:ABC transporter substrate-binding protein [Pseudotamlana carrageenivorans]|uniref:ABC transporter substrate-binding protein n=1 Tax=Pseudotamlana carrageenivorans TaxID=2069432 RepID=A0A2I7SE35_9FLAO|nr:ABC transporter substrate-binding protein [Tamlana carrageenivorans]AUS04172.1 ABC transporter substrate-binding protein [Tamlana carrageenivorans]